MREPVHVLLRKHVPDEGVFIALAHTKLFKKKKSYRTATQRMVYKHFWRTSEAE